MKTVEFMIESEVGEVDKKSSDVIYAMGGFPNVKVINRLLTLNKENNLLRAEFVCGVK